MAIRLLHLIPRLRNVLLGNGRQASFNRVRDVPRWAPREAVMSVPYEGDSKVKGTHGLTGHNLKGGEACRKSHFTSRYGVSLIWVVGVSLKLLSMPSKKL